MRTLYDGFTFEVIRDSETFQHGGFTVKGSTGIVAPSSPVQGSGDTSRFRLVTEGYSTWLSDGAPAPQGRSSGETAVPERKYVGISATLWANGEAVAINRLGNAEIRGGASYLGKDVLGSVRSRSNENGQLEDRYEYDAFGKPYKGDLNSGMNLGYTGKPYDTTTGLYNYGYRDYQPEVARFTTIDPIRDGVNWFAYVNNDPVNWVDPLGLQCISASDNANKNSPKTGLGQIVSGAMEKLGGIFLNGINALGLGLTSNSAEIAKQSERLISEGNLKIAVGQSLLTGRTNTNGKDVIPIVGVGALPPNVQNAYNGYESVNWQGNYPGQPPRTAAGRTYDNLDEALPPTDTGGSPITYKEFDVNGKQPDAGRDAERLVKGSDGATYYTGDHYGDGEPTGLPSFIEIRN